MQFYENYVRLCNSIGKSPSAVAEELGLTPAAATGWSQGAVPRKATIQKVADYFDVTVDDLLGEENVKAAAPEGSGQYEEFARIFMDLTPENQNRIIAEMLRRQREQ